MDPVPTSSATRIKRRWVFLLFWLLFLLACVPPVVTKYKQNREAKTAVDASRIRIVAREREYHTRSVGIQQIEQMLSTGHPRREDLEDTLGRGEPFTTKLKDKAMEAAVYTDPRTGVEFAMLFVNGYLMHFQHKPLPLPPLPPAPRAPPGWVLGESIRKAVAVYGPGAWVAVLVGALLVKSCRLAGANLLLAITILAAWARALDPKASFPNAFLSDSGLLLGLMLLLSIVALVWSSIRRPAPAGVCPCCQYNLTGNTSGICPECGTPIALGKVEREKAAQ
jgi:hypothetical protein